MGYCIVSGCQKTSGKEEKKLKYYTFPKDKSLCQKWVAACGERKPFKAEAARVCSLHFTEQDFRLQDILLKVPVEKRRLKLGAIPSVNLSEDENRRTSPKKNYVYKEERIQKLLEECRAPVKEECLIVRTKSTKITKHKEKVIPTPENPLTEHLYSLIEDYKDGSTQTEIDYGCSKEFHIMRLESENKKLVSVIKNQCKRALENETLRNHLGKIMTTGQINRIINPNLNSKWSSQDISDAKALYSAGPEAYKLLKQRNYPLPGLSTLRHWAGKVSVNPGKLLCVLQFMNKLYLDDESGRLCILSFGKLRLKSKNNNKNENGSSEKAQMKRAQYAYVVMVRGLIKDWSHVIYYDFHSPTNLSVLKDLIVELYNINYTVIAVVSELSSAVYRELGLSTIQPYFTHPCDETKIIFCLVDVTNIINFLWKIFIDEGFFINGYRITTSSIQEVLSYDSSLISISLEHLDRNKCIRKERSFGTELFSSSVADVIRTCWYIGTIQTDHSLECAELIDVISNWFNVFNSKYETGGETALPFGSDLENQNITLALMSDQMSCIRLSKKHSVCIDDIQINNNVLPLMLEYLSNTYNIEGIATNYLTHEHLETFFDVVRMKGRINNYPTALEFKYRLRSYILDNIVE